MALRFAYQTALAIQYLHQKKLIHRDIKPENILFDRDFNIKLCDFGWSCENDNKIRQSICGTYEYMSPEIIYLGKHDQKIDIWCLGILLYEMVHGFPPFQASNMHEMKQQFQSKHILIKKSLSRETKDLIKFILKSQYKQRPDIQQVIDHPTFKKYKNEFDKPLTREEKKLLANNFLINSAGGKGRTLPIIVEQFQREKEEEKNQKLLNEQKRQDSNNTNSQLNTSTSQNYNFQPQLQRQISDNEPKKDHNGIQHHNEQNNNVSKTLNKQQNQWPKNNYYCAKSNQSYQNSNYSLQSLQFSDNSFSSQKFRFQRKDLMPEIKQVDNVDNINQSNINMKQNYYIKQYQSETQGLKQQLQKFDFYKKPSAFNYYDKEKVQSAIQKVQKNTAQQNKSYNLYNKKYFIKEEPSIDLGKVNVYSQIQNKNNNQSFTDHFQKENPHEDSFMSDQDSLIVKNFVYKNQQIQKNSFQSPIQQRNKAYSEKSILNQLTSPEKTVKRYNLNDLSSITSSIRSIQTHKNFTLQSPKSNHVLEQQYHQKNTNNVFQNQIIKKKDDSSTYNIESGNTQNKNSFQPNELTRNDKYLNQNLYNDFNNKKTNDYQQLYQRDLEKEKIKDQTNNSNINNNYYNNYQKIKANEQNQQQRAQTTKKVDDNSYLNSYVSGSVTSMRSITSYQKEDLNGKVRRVTRIKI